MSNTENTKKYFLHHKLYFSIEGDGPLFDYLTYQHQYFLVNRPDACPSSFLLKVVNSLEKKSDAKLKNGNESFSVDSKGQTFSWTVGNSQVSLDGAQSLIEQFCLSFESGFNRMKANLLCELIWRLKLVEHDTTLVHAACVSRNDKTILLPAWKSMGKTAVCLKLVEAGYGFMADDRIWLSATGEVFAYPRYVVIKDSNLAFFPDFTTAFRKVKQHFLLFVEKTHLIRRASLLQRLKRMLIPAKYFYIDELYPDSEIVKTSVLTDVIGVMKLDKVQEPILHSDKSDALAAASWLTGNVEWNYPLLTLAAAHDLLCPDGPSWMSEIQQLMKRERQIIEGAFARAKCSKLCLPVRDELVDWQLITSRLNDL